MRRRVELGTKPSNQLPPQVAMTLIPGNYRKTEYKEAL